GRAAGACAGPPAARTRPRARWTPRACRSAPARRRTPAAAQPCPWRSSRDYDGAVPETVVLLHGFGGTHRTWDGVAERLEAERYRPLALDLPGHGEAAEAERPITFAGCVEHVLARVPARFTLGG